MPDSISIKYGAILCKDQTCLWMKLQPVEPVFFVSNGRHNVAARADHFKVVSNFVYRVSVGQQHLKIFCSLQLFRHELH